MTLERQSADPAYASYPENVRWAVKSVMFAGLHIVGSNNNLGRTPAGDAEYAARNAANLTWLAGTFERARAEGHKAVMLIIQANPDFEAACGAAHRIQRLSRGARGRNARLRKAGRSRAWRLALLPHRQAHGGRAERPARRALHTRRDLRRDTTIIGFTWPSIRRTRTCSSSTSASSRANLIQH